MSGPAAGASAAAEVSRALALDHAISLDMGGTTTDVCLITRGRPEMATDRALNGRPLRQAMVAVESIGAGGGSIARLDHGALCVGPESAGADPGPASYGRGGTQATVTDANLLLGYLSRERLFGNALRLDAAAARTAVGTLAAAAGMDLVQTALGIVAVVNQAMVRALRRITVERGIDGRRCALIAFGGAGPMHAAAVAGLFGISRIVVPAASSVFSALGCVGADMGYSQQRSLRMPHDAWDCARLAAVERELRARLAAPLVAAGHGDDELEVERTAAVRFRGQSYSVEIADPDLSDADHLGRRFMDRHRALYGFATAEPWELVALRLRVWAPRQTGHRPAAFAAAGAGSSSLLRVDRCIFDRQGELETPRLERSSLPPGKPVRGPAIVEDAFSTVVLPPGATLTPDPVGHLLMDVGAV
jgi:N-methylhydantoinase A